MDDQPLGVFRAQQGLRLRDELGWRTLYPSISVDIRRYASMWTARDAGAL
ncbi:hypothetical protein AB0B95_10645 [Streptomyces hygroscopicus]|nr:hypothetical protein [Streptomyces hygroscopicus]